MFKAIERVVYKISGHDDLNAAANETVVLPNHTEVATKIWTGGLKAMVYGWTTGLVTGASIVFLVMYGNAKNVDWEDPEDD